MKVFKFGGGSVKTTEGIKQLENILRLHSEEQLIVVISAIGKTTNLLEKILDAWYNHDEQMSVFFKQLIDNHNTIADELDGKQGVLKQKLAPIFEQLNEILNTNPSSHFEADYDRLVSFGELLSTTLISAYLQSQKCANTWIDARKLIVTDGCHREGRVNWVETTPLIHRFVTDFFKDKNNKIMVTQGFIGSSHDDSTVTLGREGSDYSAAVFGFCAHVESVTVWKDVAGLFNADPHLFPEAVKLDKISYEEAIELSYYGASVIHPKTIKPLQNKNIPLFVKSFFNPLEVGTIIDHFDHDDSQVPSFIFKNSQILISFFPKDFSFIAVNNLSQIFTVLSANRINVNLMQNSALSFSVCFDYHQHKVEQLIHALENDYIIKYNEDVVLATIRHYTSDSLDKILDNRKILIEQKNRTTLQVVLKNKKNQ